MTNLGTRVYGLAAIMMGIVGLVWDDFTIGGMAVPAALPGRAVLAYAVAAVLLAGGVLINVRRTAQLGAGLLTAVFGTGVVLLELTRLIPHLPEFGYWESTAIQLAMTAGGLIAFASLSAGRRSAPLVRSALIVFALCLLVFGLAHFVYADYTASLVPPWLQPGPMFWTYFTGAAAIAAGLAILSGIWALLAARLLTAMYIVFGLLVHAPNLWAAPAKHFNWTEFMVNLALAGAAWIVADEAAARRTSSG